MLVLKLLCFYQIIFSADGTKSLHHNKGIITNRTNQIAAIEPIRLQQYNQSHCSNIIFCFIRSGVFLSGKCAFITIYSTAPLFKSANCKKIYFHINKKTVFTYLLLFQKMSNLVFRA